MHTFLLLLFFISAQLQCAERSTDQRPFLHFLQEAVTLHNEKKETAAKKPESQLLLDLLYSHEATETKLLNILIALEPEKIKALEPIKETIKRLTSKPLRANLHATIDAKREGLKKIKEAQNIDLINYYHIHEPELLDDPLISKKLDAIENLFTFDFLLLRTPDLPNGFYKTDCGLVVEIDQEEIMLGQRTKYGTVVAIKNEIEEQEE